MLVKPNTANILSDATCFWAKDCTSWIVDGWKRAEIAQRRLKSLALGCNILATYSLVLIEDRHTWNTLLLRLNTFFKKISSSG
jgi:hypothetical protein